MRPTLPQPILDERIIPVARGLDADSAPDLAAALLDGGISVIEITIEGKGGLDAIRSLRDSKLLVGAGTVTSVDKAEAAVEAGARFLVSPHTDRQLIEWSVDSSVTLIPGGMTPTEIMNAWSFQVPAVKVFPASIGGPGLIRSLLAPYPGLALIPTGGIDGESASSYLMAGAVAVGIGGWLTKHQDMGIVTERAAQLRQVV